MTRNSDLRLIGVDAAATGETLKGGFTPAMGAAPLKAMSAEDRPGQPLARASIAALAVFVVGAGLSYVAQLVTARIIGPDSYGVYAYVLAWATLLGYSSTLGFHVSLLRFVPAYQAKEEWGLVRGVIQYSERGAAGTAAGIVLIGVCGIVALHGSMRPELAYTFLLGIAAVPFLALHLIGASVVRAFGGVVAALAPERVVRDSLLLAIMAVAFWGNLYRLDATLAMGATLVSSLVMLGLVRIFLRRLRPPVPRPREAGVCGRRLVAANVAAHGDHGRGQFDDPLRRHRARSGGQYAGRRHLRRGVQHGDPDGIAADGGCHRVRAHRLGVVRPGGSGGAAIAQRQGSLLVTSRHNLHRHPAAAARAASPRVVRS